MCWVVLGSTTRETVRRAASECGVPIELWVRIAVESMRLTQEISQCCGQSEEWVRETLSVAALAAANDQPQNVAPVTLDHYASALERHHPAGRAADCIALRLPEEMVGAWHRDAARQHLSLPKWITQRLDDPPVDCIRWEIAAARSSQTLSEWAYASSLRALASLSA
jgi:hypothetical protein